MRKIVPIVLMLVLVFSLIGVVGSRPTRSTIQEDEFRFPVSECFAPVQKI